ncbi:hypothetical protein QQF64_016991 [Cirrhinus molitorella]|uniref:Uncharacterized protein n=1 Tax=Cirrhinus molitorella TaxID=172907 RepID=A0ABR3LPD0_9TELE
MTYKYRSGCRGGATDPPPESGSDEAPAGEVLMNASGRTASGAAATALVLNEKTVRTHGYRNQLRHNNRRVSADDQTESCRQTLQQLD